MPGSTRGSRHLNEIVIREDHWTGLRDRLLSVSPRESAAFLLAGVVETERRTRFIVREIIHPDESGYDIQQDLLLCVSPRFFNRVISQAERQRLGVVLCHTHPFGGGLQYSHADDRGEHASSSTLLDCLDGLPVGSVLIGPSSERGRVWRAQEREPQPLDRIRVIGPRIREIGQHNGQVADTPPWFDRHARAFGPAGQVVLRAQRIAIVGTGATGSAVAENLVRLGVGEVSLFDPDRVEESNVTRMFGTTLGNAQEQSPKVEAVARHLNDIWGKENVEAHQLNVVSAQGVKALRDFDFIFSCTDRHAPRSVVNDVAYQAGVPAVDMGVGLDVHESRIEGGSVRASVIGPGLPCMICQGILRPELVAMEALPANERIARQREGYVPTVDHAPSVITFTSLAAGFATSLYLDMMFAFSSRTAPTIVFDLATFQTRRILADRDPLCICTQREARGDQYPYPIVGDIK